MTNEVDNQYNNLVLDILSNGSWSENRTGIKTKRVFGKLLKFNLKDGFPLLTTRKLPIKSTWIELEGFIKGITYKDWYKSRGCHYWDHWNIENNENDLGPLGYAWGWRKFGAHYGNDEDFWDVQIEDLNGLMNGYDQLKTIVEKIRENKDDRRLVCVAWNPNQNDLACLYPCHFAWQANIMDGKLNLCWMQRSVDVVCGLPANISSYATLAYLLAYEGNLDVGELTAFLGDTHIYENHLDKLKEQIARPSFSLPKIEFDKYEDIFSWTNDKCRLINYQAGEKIKYDVAI